MKQFSPAAARNQGPIFEVLNPLLPPRARVLEIASGSGQHADFICRQRPDLLWQPTDRDPEALASIRAIRSDGGPDGLLEPMDWSVMETRPPALAEAYDAVVNINMIHIAPWDACLSLFQHAAELLPEKGLLFLYGPFFVKDRETAPSNLDFDRSLRDRNPLWGIRELERVQAEAANRGLILEKTVDMPANNLSVIFRHRKGTYDGRSSSLGNPSRP